MPVDGFLASLDDEDRSQHTIDNYRVNLTLFVRWFTKTNRCDWDEAKVTPSDIKAYRKYLQGLKRAPSTINFKLSTLKVFFNWAVDEGLVVSNPTRKIKPIRQGQRAPKWLDRPDMFAILRAAEQDIQLAEVRGNQRKILIARRTYTMLVMMLHAGLRVSEVCVLQRDDIELHSRSGKVIVRQGKGRKYREIPLNSDARQAVGEWLDVWSGDKYLFDNLKTGKPLRPRTVQYALARVGRLAGLEKKLTPHQLRHTFGKRLVDEVSLEKASALLGHAKLDTTAIYTVPSQADLEAAVEEISWSD